MAARKDFRLRLIRAERAVTEKRSRDRAPKAKAATTPRAVLTSLKATTGANEILKQVPAFGDIALWSQVAYFSVCRKSGSAQYLDLWDVDNFDGFTDMRRCLDDCRAWFSADGFTTWGSGQTKTGRINCYFRAPATGDYICNARLQSYPSSTTSVVECLIDNSTFGPLTWSGTIDQPHPCHLAAGSHHFRIRQVRGAFFFLSLTVWRV